MRCGVTSGCGRRDVVVVVDVVVELGNGFSIDGATAVTAGGDDDEDEDADDDIAGACSATYADDDDDDDAAFELSVRGALISFTRSAYRRVFNVCSAASKANTKIKLSTSD